jgi:hypothetical protein
MRKFKKISANQNAVVFESVYRLSIFTLINVVVNRYGLHGQICPIVLLSLGLHAVLYRYDDMILQSSPKTSYTESVYCSYHRLRQ